MKEVGGASARLEEEKRGRFREKEEGREMLGDEAAAAEAASTAASSSPTAQRAFLRARRRVRQRVDAGEPRNSYSSIPGYSFRFVVGPQTTKGNSSSSLTNGPRMTHFHDLFGTLRFPLA